MSYAYQFLRSEKYSIPFYSCPTIHRTTLIKILATFLGLVDWQINVPFHDKIGYIEDKVLGGDILPPA